VDPMSPLDDGDVEEQAATVRLTATPRAMAVRRRLFMRSSLHRDRAPDVRES